MSKFDFLTEARVTEHTDRPKKNIAKRNSVAGHSYERFVRDLFRKAGYPHVVCSAGESKSRDAQKVDLMNKDEWKNGRLPYNVQAKNVAGLIDYARIFTGYKKLVKDKLITVPAMAVVPGIVNVIVHKHTERVNDKFQQRGQYAILPLHDFMSMVTELNQLRELQKTIIHNESSFD